MEGLHKHTHGVNSCSSLIAARELISASSKLPVCAWILGMFICLFILVFKLLYLFFSSFLRNGALVKERVTYICVF